MHRTAIVTRPDADETLEIGIVDPASLPRTSFVLRVIEGQDAGQVLTLDPASPPHAVLGQSSSCAIKLTDPHVSRRHIALTATATHVLLMDLGSRNGTRVNGVLVREARLYGGETIAIGRTVIGVETDLPRAANEPSTLPPPPVRAVSEIRVPQAAPVPAPPSPSPEDLITLSIDEGLSFSDARARIVADFERRYIEELLTRHNGNVTHAARASGLAHRYFQLVRARSK
ncbi:MAG: FHA domain-containing protein [Labilithrix sp.]|nr:FHA domain-containing protein [Labilithrix sp.]MCW5816718.1 FHA domain-containing protein [Labilithrix sp.]